MPIIFILWIGIELDRQEASRKISAPTLANELAVLKPAKRNHVIVTAIECPSATLFFRGFSLIQYMQADWAHEHKFGLTIYKWEKNVMEDETKPTANEKQMEAINSSGLCPLLIRNYFRAF